MPLYLCQSGLGHAEPWRHGIEVYSAPHHKDNTVHMNVIRRIRHAEVVLADDICISHGRYWLRLRWPGHRGGFAGYIAIQDVITKQQEEPPPLHQKTAASLGVAMNQTNDDNDDDDDDNHDDTMDDNNTNQDIVNDGMDDSAGTLLKTPPPPTL